MSKSKEESGSFARVIDPAFRWQSTATETRSGTKTLQNEGDTNDNDHDV